MVDEGRRRWLKWACGGLACGIGGLVAAPVVATLAWPARAGRRVIGGADDPIAVGAMEDFGEVPRRVELAQEIRDAWAVRPRVRLGGAWVVRSGDQVRAFTTACPHLGCPVGYDAAERVFRCPCHTSSFDGQTGERKSGPAPRGLDPLPLSTEGGLVQIRFRRFRPDIAERVEI
jgi:Rieske Fe-S protein